jgi:hypothetical protein
VSQNQSSLAHPSLHNCSLRLYRSIATPNVWIPSAKSMKQNTGKEVRRRPRTVYGGPYRSFRFRKRPLPDVPGAVALAGAASARGANRRVRRPGGSTARHHARGSNGAQRLGAEVRRRWCRGRACASIGPCAGARTSTSAHEGAGHAARQTAVGVGAWTPRRSGVGAGDDDRRMTPAAWPMNRQTSRANRPNRPFRADSA